ncbi:MAG: DUF2065 domain-containing protein [Betaproteobacteria bacterium]|nr:DUF2065 domain-containing protein [Betaproteobacteria bacterium]
MTVAILSAFALMLVLEGILPFLAPKLWREMFRRATELADGQVRVMGLGSMALGVGLLVMFK